MTYQRTRAMLGTIVYILDGRSILAGKLVQVDQAGNAQVLLVDGRTVIRDAHYGIFYSEHDAIAIAAELSWDKR